MSDSLGSLIATVAIVAFPLLFRVVVARIASFRQQASPVGGHATAQQDKPRKTSTSMRVTVALYSFLALAMWFTSQSDLFTRLRLPITATGDQIRSALITQRPPEFIPLDLQRTYQQNTHGLNIRKDVRTSHPLFTPELDRTLQRIETFDIRLMYGRLGHSVIASCDWCTTRDDYLLFAAVGLSLSYIALLCMVGVVTEAPERRKSRAYAVVLVALAVGLDVFCTGLVKGSLRKGGRVQYYPRAQLCRLALHIILPTVLLMLPHNAPYLTQETYINTMKALASLSHVSTAQQSTIKNTRYAGLVREASLPSWSDITMRKVDAALNDDEFRTTLDQIRPPPPEVDQEKPAVERLKDWAGRVAGETLRDLDGFITAARSQPV